MTTIAYKDGIIAYDSRETLGTTIVDDDCDKCQARDGVLFFCTGSSPDFEALLAAYFGEVSSVVIEAGGVALDKGALWLLGYSETTGFWKDRLRMDNPWSVGSGSPHALTAMDMGASAYQAVEMAMKRDTGTGGTIRTFTIKAE
jgi:20S proteasome alpha/beta subunit